MTITASKYLILVDSDAFVGLMYEQDAHHERCNKLFNHIMEQRQALVTTNYVVAETATVLSHRQDQALARKFIGVAEKFPVIHINEDLHRAALDLFREQEQKRTSVVDCSNIVVMRQFQIPTIFSFDAVYSKKFGLQTAV